MSKVKTSSQIKQIPVKAVIRPVTATAYFQGSALSLKRRWYAGLKKRKNKFHAVKCEAGENYPEAKGVTFDSKAERDRACQLILLQRQGLLRNLRFHPLVLLTDSALKYKADFSYEEQAANFTGFHLFYEDVKGKEKYPFITIKQLWPEYGTGILRIVKKRGNRFVVTKEIMRGASINYIAKSRKKTSMNDGAFQRITGKDVV